MNLVLALGESERAVILQTYELASIWISFFFKILLTYHGENCGKHFNLLGQRSGVVLPVHLDGGLSKEQSQVELSVNLAKAVVRTSAKNEVVLGARLLSIACVVTLGVEVVGVLVNFGIVESEVGSGNDHGTLGGCVFGGDGESLLSQVGNHDNRWAPSKKLTDNSTGISQRFELIHSELSVNVAITDPQVLLTNAIQNIWSLSVDLEQPSGSAAGGILRGEEESEDSLRNLVVVEHAQKRLGLLHLAHISTLGLSVSPLLRLEDLEDPGIHNTVGLTASSHADLGFGSALGELGENHVGSLLTIPSLGERDDDGEVDELEGGGNQIVVIGNLLHSLVGDVVSNKGTERNGAHELTELRHERNRLATSILGNLQELFEISPVNLMLAGEIAFKSLASEEAVETLAEVDVGFAVKEDPVIVSEELVCDIDDAGLDVGRRVEDFASHITSRGKDNEPGEKTLAFFL